MNGVLAAIRMKHLRVKKDQTLFKVLKRYGRRGVSMKGKIAE